MKNSGGAYLRRSSHRIRTLLDVHDMIHLRFAILPHRLRPDIRRFFSILLASVASLTMFGAAPPALDSVESSLLKAFDGDVKVTASTMAIDRKTVLDRILIIGAVDFVQYDGDQRIPIRVTTQVAGKTPNDWPKGDSAPVLFTVPGHSSNWMIRSGDSIVVPVQADLTESVSVRYDPPEVRAFAGTDPKPAAMSVKVFDIHGTGSPKHTGSLKVTARDRGVWKVSTPGGTFDAVLYRIDYKGEIGPASVDDSSLVFVSPTAGIIASVNHKKVSAFLLYNADTRFAYTLPPATE